MHRTTRDHVLAYEALVRQRRAGARRRAEAAACAEPAGRRAAPYRLFGLGRVRHA